MATGKNRDDKMLSVINATYGLLEAHIKILKIHIYYLFLPVANMEIDIHI